MSGEFTRRAQPSVPIPRARNFRPLTPRPQYGAIMRQGSCGTHDTDNDGCQREVGDANTSCSQYSDAMVCTQSSDVTCSGEIYRGCFYGQSDTDPDTDYCCAGFSDGMANDNIDHAHCSSGYDAGWGSSCYFWDSPGSSL